MQNNQGLMDFYAEILKLTPKSIKTLNFRQVVRRLTWSEYLTAIQQQQCSLQIKLLNERCANLQNPNYVEPKSLLQWLADWFHQPLPNCYYEAETSKHQAQEQKQAKSLQKQKTPKYKQSEKTEQTEPLNSDKNGTIFQTYKGSLERIKRNK